MKLLHQVLLAVVFTLILLPVNAATTKTGNVIVMTADADTQTLPYGTTITGVKVVNPTADKFYRILDGSTAGSGGELFRERCKTTSDTLPMNAMDFRVMSTGINLDSDDTNTYWKVFIYIK